MFARGKINKSCCLYLKMRVVRKRRKGIKIELNWKLLLIIIVLLILFAVVVNLILKNMKEIVGVVKEDLCVKDSDCVSASCCHPTECVIKEKSPACEGIFCSAVCSGPLDCNAGQCGCVDNKCVVVQNE